MLYIFRMNLGLFPISFVLTMLSVKAYRLDFLNSGDVNFI